MSTTESTDTEDSDIERRRRWRNQCAECNLLVNLDRMSIVDGEVVCVRCAGDDEKPWYVPADVD